MEMEQNENTHHVVIDIVDLFEYASESRRTWLEGNEVYRNNHVLLVGVTEVRGDRTHIFGSCLRGSKPSEPPRQVTIVTSSQFKDWDIKCSCPAGAFRCKHQFACLLYIHNKKRLDILTPTELRQQWGKVATAQSTALYEPIRLKRLCDQQNQASSKDYLNDSSVSDQILQLFVNELPDSALSKSIQGRNTLRPDKTTSSTEESQAECSTTTADFIPMLPSWNPRSRKADLAEQSDVPCETELIKSHIRSLLDKPNMSLMWMNYHGPLSSAEQYTFYKSHVQLSLDECIHIATTTCDASPERWRKERRMRITASVCYDLFTFYRNDDGKRDWSKKISSIIHPLELHLPALEFGKITEAEALSCYKQRNSEKVISRMGLMIPPIAPFLGCTPDGVIFEDKKLIEIKCPVSGKYFGMDGMLKQLKYLNQENGTFYLRKKHAYYGQVQLGMCLLRLQTTDFIIYNKLEKNYTCINVKYDSTFLKSLIPTLREVYFNVMLPKLCEK